MKRTKRKILIFFFSLLLLYMVPSIYVSAKVYTIARSSYDSYGNLNPYSDIVSDETFRKLCYRSDVTLFDQTATEKDFMIFPITYFWDGAAKTTYWYSYEAQDEKGEGVSGSRNVPVYITLHLIQGKWRITDHYEHP